MLIRVCIVPPEKAPFNDTAETDAPSCVSGPASALSVRLARWTARSDGSESNPLEGMMIARFLLAR